MKLEQDAKVFTADDKQVGHLDRVVIDPKTKKATHIVVRKGLIFTEDKVVPINLIASVKGDRVTLREDAGDLEALPKFEERHHVPLDEEERSRIGNAGINVPPYYLYPPYGIPSYLPLRPIEVVQNIPQGTIALKEGAEVTSADGEYVGKVEEVLTSAQVDQVTHFVVSQGLLTKTRKLIPSTWVSRLEEDKVHLEVNSRLLGELPEYQT
jgi:uncharacterized protein YrrD